MLGVIEPSGPEEMSGGSAQDQRELTGSVGTTRAISQGISLQSNRSEGESSLHRSAERVRVELFGELGDSGRHRF